MAAVNLKLLVTLIIPIIIMAQDLEKLENIPDDSESGRMFGLDGFPDKIWKAVCDRICHRSKTSSTVRSNLICFVCPITTTTKPSPTGTVTLPPNLTTKKLSLGNVFEVKQTVENKVSVNVIPISNVASNQQPTKLPSGIETPSNVTVTNTGNKTLSNSTIISTTHLPPTKEKPNDQNSTVTAKPIHNPSGVNASFGNL